MASSKRGTKAKAGGVHFAVGRSHDEAHNHVHFEDKLHDSVVMVTQDENGCYLVKVGFLKILHKYEITFTVPFSQKVGTNICAAPIPNVNLKVLNIIKVQEGHRLKCEYTAHKEGVLKEELILASETDDNATVKVIIQARVMDRHHGTPMLLDGVRCIGEELEYDSEHSDWQGFD